MSTRSTGLKRLKNKLARLREKKAFAPCRMMEDYYKKECEKMEKRIALAKEYQS